MITLAIYNFIIVFNAKRGKNETKALWSMQ